MAWAMNEMTDSPCIIPTLHGKRAWHTQHPGWGASESPAQPLTPISHQPIRHTTIRTEPLLRLQHSRLQCCLCTLILHHLLPHRRSRSHIQIHNLRRWCSQPMQYPRCFQLPRRFLRDPLIDRKPHPTQIRAKVGEELRSGSRDADFGEVTQRRFLHNLFTDV